MEGVNFAPKMQGKKQLYHFDGFFRHQNMGGVVIFIVEKAINFDEWFMIALWFIPLRRGGEAAGEAANVSSDRSYRLIFQTISITLCHFLSISYIYIYVYIHNIYIYIHNIYIYHIYIYITHYIYILFPDIHTIYSFLYIQIDIRRAAKRRCGGEGCRRCRFATRVTISSFYGKLMGILWEYDGNYMI